MTSTYDPDLFRSRPSESLAKMAKASLEEMGGFDDLRNKIDSVIQPQTQAHLESIADHLNDHKNSGLY